MEISVYYAPLTVLLIFIVITLLVNKLSLNEPRTKIGFFMVFIIGIFLTLILMYYVILLILYLFGNVKFV